MPFQFSFCFIVLLLCMFHSVKNHSLCFCFCLCLCGLTVVHFLTSAFHPCSELLLSWSQASNGTLCAFLKLKVLQTASSVTVSALLCVCMHKTPCKAHTVHMTLCTNIPHVSMPSSMHSSTCKLLMCLCVTPCVHDAMNVHMCSSNACVKAVMPLHAKPTVSPQELDDGEKPLPRKNVAVTMVPNDSGPVCHSSLVLMFACTMMAHDLGTSGSWMMTDNPKLPTK